MTLKTITITLLILLSALFVNADDKSKEKEPKYLPINLEKGDLPTTRPRAPAMAADIECYYYDGYIHIEFSEAEGDATLRLVDEMTTESASYSFSTLSPFTVYIGVPTDVLRIEVVTSYGNTYVGYLTEW